MKQRKKNRGGAGLPAQKNTLREGPTAVAKKRNYNEPPQGENYHISCLLE